MFDQIANVDLKSQDIPEPNAKWYRICEFALTFDGYDRWGSFNRCAEIGNQSAQAYAERQVLPDSLTDLRTCLFFEQRRWHHFGGAPEGEAIVYIRALLEAIRHKIRAKEVN